MNKVRSHVLLAGLAIACAAHADWAPIAAPPIHGRAAATSVTGVMLMQTGPMSGRGMVDGSHWTAGLADVPAKTLYPSPDLASLAFAITYNGEKPLWRTVDAGTTWHELKVARFGAFAVGGSGVAYGVTEDGGAFYSSVDAGLTWRKSSDDRTVPPCAFFGDESVISTPVGAPNVVYAVGSCGLMRSTDFGVHWSSINRFDSPRWVVASATNANRVFIPGSVSDDMGATWRALPSDGPVLEDRFDPDTYWSVFDFRRLVKRSMSGAILRDLSSPTGSTPTPLSVPSPGEIVVVDLVDDAAYRWSGDGWAVITPNGAPPAGMVGLGRTADGGILGASGARLLNAFGGAVTNDFYERMPSGQWKIGALSSPQSFATAPFTGVTYGMKAGACSGALFPFNCGSFLYRLDGEKWTQLGALISPDGCRIAGFSPSSAAQFAYACSSSSQSAGDTLFVDQLPGGAPVQVRALPAGERFVDGAWHADGTLAALTTQHYYRDVRTSLPQPLPRSGAVSLALDPRDSSRIFISFGDGILASTDGGLTWQPFGRGADLRAPVLLGAPEGLYASSYQGFFLCADFACFGDPPQGTPVVDLVELFDPAGGHYFMSANPAEVKSLVASGVWRETRQVIATFARPLAGASEVRRYVGRPGILPPTHFYTPLPSPDAAVDSSPEWIEERPGAGYVFSPNADGTCTAGRPVMRLIKVRPGGDFNHRWVFDPALAGEMVRHGWINEGVRFCAA